MALSSSRIPFRKHRFNVSGLSGILLHAVDHTDNENKLGGSESGLGEPHHRFGDLPRNHLSDRQLSGLSVLSPAGPKQQPGHSDHWNRAVGYGYILRLHLSGLNIFLIPLQPERCEPLF